MPHAIDITTCASCPTKLKPEEHGGRCATCRAFFDPERWRAEGLAKLPANHAEPAPYAGSFRYRIGR